MTDIQNLAAFGRSCAEALYHRMFIEVGVSRFRAQIGLRTGRTTVEVMASANESESK